MPSMALALRAVRRSALSTRRSKSASVRGPTQTLAVASAGSRAAGAGRGAGAARLGAGGFFAVASGGFCALGARQASSRTASTAPCLHVVRSTRTRCPPQPSVGHA